MKKYMSLLVILLISMMFSSGVMGVSAQGDKDDDPGLSIVPPPNNPPPGQGGPNDPPRDPNDPPRDPNNPPRDPQTPGDNNQTPSGQDDFTSQPSDIDGDGIPDGNDNCPTVAGVLENSGCPPTNHDSSNTDTDGDGIPDRDDVCPTVAGVPENNGCPGDPFTPPVLPTFSCYATPAGNYQVWVRPQSNDTQPALGHLNAGTVYSGIGFVIAPDNTLWLAMLHYEGSTGLVGYAADWAILTSNCPVLGPIEPIDAVFTATPLEAEEGKGKPRLIVTVGLILDPEDDCNENDIPDLDEYPLPDCFGGLTTEDPIPASGAAIVRLPASQVPAEAPINDCNHNNKEDLDEFWPPPCYGKLTAASDPSPVWICYIYQGQEYCEWISFLSSPNPMGEDQNDLIGFRIVDDDDNRGANGNTGADGQPIDQGDIDAMVLSCGEGKDWYYIFENDEVVGYGCEDKAASNPDTGADGQPIDQGDIDAMVLSCGEDKDWYYIFEDDEVVGYGCEDKAQVADPTFQLIIVPEGGDDDDIVVIHFVSLSEDFDPIEAILTAVAQYSMGKDRFERSKIHVNAGSG